MEKKENEIMKLINDYTERMNKKYKENKEINKFDLDQFLFTMKNFIETITIDRPYPIGESRIEELDRRHESEVLGWFFSSLSERKFEQVSRKKRFAIADAGHGQANGYSLLDNELLIHIWNKDYGHSMYILKCTEVSW